MYAFRITIIQSARWKVWRIWIFKTFCPSTIYVWSISTRSVIVISGSREWKGLHYEKWNYVVNHKPITEQWNNNNKNTPPKMAKVCRTCAIPNRTCRVRARRDAFQNIHRYVCKRAENALESGEMFVSINVWTGTSAGEFGTVNPIFSPETQHAFSRYV